MLKKISAVILALVLFLVPMVNVYAQTTPKQQYPVVEVPGFMSREIRIDKNDKDSKIVWPPAAEDILACAGKIAPYIAKFCVDKNWDAFADGAFPLAGELLAPACCDSNGEVTNGSGVYFTYPDAESVTADGSYTFYYDWRVDPLISAAELNDFIDYILKCSGSDKVSLVAHSLGGVITLSYLTVYGDSKVDGVCFFLTAIYGEAYNGQLMQGKLSLDADCITEFMRGTFSDNEYAFLLSGIFDLLNQLGILDAVCACANYTLDKTLDAAALYAVLPLFANWLTIWSMVPDADVEPAIDYVFNKMYKDVDRSVILEKINRYNEVVRASKEETLKKLNEDAKVVVISGYGFSPIPIVPEWRVLGDTNIDTKNTSFGAVTAPYGEKLSEEYIASADPKYISPEENIDASTCLFPEQTWFVENIKHTSRTDSINRLIETLLFSESQPYVDTYEQYPRFLTYSPDNDTILPHTQAKPVPTSWQKLIYAFKDLFRLIKNLFENIGK